MTIMSRTASGWDSRPTLGELAREIEDLEKEARNQAAATSLSIAAEDLRELGERDALASAYSLLTEAVDVADCVVVREDTREVQQAILGLLGGVEP